MPAGRWNAIRDLLDYTDRVDPNNSRTGQMRAYVNKLEAVTATIQQLQAKAAKTPLSAHENLSLAQSLLALGRSGAAAEAARKALALPDAAHSFDLAYSAALILSQCGQRGDAANAMKRAAAAMPPSADARMRRETAAVLSEGGLNAEAETVLNAYLRVQPKDPEAWLQLALVKDALGQTQNAQSAILQAYKLNPELTSQRLGASEPLQKVAAPLFRRK